MFMNENLWVIFRIRKFQPIVKMCENFARQKLLKKIIIVPYGHDNNNCKFKGQGLSFSDHFSRSVLNKVVDDALFNHKVVVEICTQL